MAISRRGCYRWRGDGIGRSETVSRKQSKEDTEGRRSEPRKTSRKTPIKESATPSRSGRSASKTDEAANNRKRSDSAPAKRVISDQHWRKKPGLPNVDDCSRTTRKRSPSNVRDQSIEIKSNKEQAAEEKLKDTTTTPSPKPSSTRRNRTSGGTEHHLASPHDQIRVQEKFPSTNRENR